MKKGQVWISAVLYMALGIAVLVIILAVGTPVIKNMKDRLTISQTKDIMFTIDENIRAVYNQGPGAQRPLSIKINRGTFKVDETQETIRWELKSPLEFSEPNTEVREGTLKILTSTTESEDFLVSLFLDYNTILDITIDGTSDFSGTHKILIRNEGNSEISITDIR